MADNKEVHAKLLKAGADPAWRNNVGTSVLNLYITRNQLEMAEDAYQALPDQERRNAFINQKSKVGKLMQFK